MIKFLIDRPIAVIMTYVAILTLGLVAIGILPVSLMPDIDIPEITVQVSRPGQSVRQIEDGVIRQMRFQLMQIPHLEDMTSETRDGNAVIRLRFRHGADINYAFIEVNEKVDAAMRSLPADMERPAIIKASASDLPVFYINLWRKGADEVQFLELSSLAKNVLIKRLEQLPEVAMVDMTGHLDPELYIEPDETLLKSLGLSHYDIVNALNENNIDLGTLQVADGQYLFSIRFTNALTSPDDVKDIRLRVGQRFMKLSELAKIGVRAREQDGAFLRGNERALSLAVIKHSDARMKDLRRSVQELIDRFDWEFPEVEAEVIRDQTALLTYSINDLRDNLVIGGLLAFVILFFFLKDSRAPWLIGISIPMGLMVSLLFFYLAGLSINIVSLSGLILGIGLMIDNSIIVIDNITQYLDRNVPLAEACAKATTEVISPLLSSALTTVAVFVPLVFLSGISGALFHDQAFGVGIGLFASLVVSITIIPVLYYLFYKKAHKKDRIQEGKITKMLRKVNLFNIEENYAKGFDWVFGYRKVSTVICVLLLIPMILLFVFLKKERFPHFQHSDVLVSIDWNERINLSENSERVKALNSIVGDFVSLSTSYVGTQKYFLHRDIDQSISEAMIYFECKDPDNLGAVEEAIKGVIAERWPSAVYEFKVPETVFDKLFADDEPDIIAKVSNSDLREVPDYVMMQNISEKVGRQYPWAGVLPPAGESYMEIIANAERLLLYDVDVNALYERLRIALDAWQVGVLHSGSEYIPIVIGNPPKGIEALLKELKVRSRNNLEIPVSALVDTRIKHDYKSMLGDARGVYVPVNFYNVPDRKVEGLMKDVSRTLKTDYNLDVSFAGSWFGSRELIRELAVVLLIALALLYFILAAQFESLSQPVILLLEIPVAILGGLFMLWIFGSSINIMSMIGIIVMSGVVLNDSILKIDTINRLRAEGMPLLPAIKEGGHRRLKSIIMTALTTVLALVPVLWGSGMGSELQRPLALTIIGGMIIGTFISLYVIPLFYYYIYRKSDERSNELAD